MSEIVFNNSAVAADVLEAHRTGSVIIAMAPIVDSDGLSARLISESEEDNRMIKEMTTRGISGLTKQQKQHFILVFADIDQEEFQNS